MRAEDAQGLTPAQIKNDWAIPGEAPDQFVFVDVPDETNMLLGPAAQNAFGAGGGIQYQLLDQIPNESFSAPMPISDFPGVVIPDVTPNVTPDVMPGEMPEGIDPEIIIP